MSLLTELFYFVDPFAINILLLTELQTPALGASSIIIVHPRFTFFLIL